MSSLSFSLLISNLTIGKPESWNNTECEQKKPQEKLSFWPEEWEAGVGVEGHEGGVLQDRK